MKSVEVIFDTSALTRYARLEGIQAGELIGEVEATGGLVGIPAPALLAAFGELDNETDGKDSRQRLVDLTVDDDTAVVVLPFGHHNWLDVAARMYFDGRCVLPVLALMQCLSEVDLSDHPAPVATYEPAPLRRAGLAEEYILDLGAGWDMDPDS